MTQPAPTPPPPTPSAVTWSDPAREAAFTHWLGRGAPPRAGAGQPAPGLGRRQLRRYLRLQGSQGARIVMDAPPTRKLRPFVQVAALMAEAGLNVPQVLEWDQATASCCSATWASTP
jgi:aminoglycoside/choline kinase family phosphotransferase